MPSDLFEYLLRLGDDRLVLGHRLSEWCGHAPILEEDIALTNIALDLVGQALVLGDAPDEGEDGRDVALDRRPDRQIAWPTRCAHRYFPHGAMAARLILWASRWRPSHSASRNASLIRSSG